MLLLSSRSALMLMRKILTEQAFTEFRRYNLHIIHRTVSFIRQQYNIVSGYSKVHLPYHYHILQYLNKKRDLKKINSDLSDICYAKYTQMVAEQYGFICVFISDFVMHLSRKVWNCGNPFLTFKIWYWPWKLQLTKGFLWIRVIMWAGVSPVVMVTTDDDHMFSFFQNEVHLQTVRWLWPDSVSPNGLSPSEAISLSQAWPVRAFRPAELCCQTGEGE